MFKDKKEINVYRVSSTSNEINIPVLEKQDRNEFFMH